MGLNTKTKAIIAAISVTT